MGQGTPVDPWEFRLHIPGKPQAWKRAGHSKLGFSFTPNEVRKYQARVKSLALKAWGSGRAPVEHCVEVCLWLSFPLNKTGSEPGAGRFGDADNLSKCILDALQGVVYKNDNQVWPLTVHRIRGNRDGGAFVEISPSSGIESLEMETLLETHKIMDMTCPI